MSTSPTPETYACEEVLAFDQLRHDNKELHDDIMINTYTELLGIALKIPAKRSFREPKDFVATVLFKLSSDLVQSCLKNLAYIHQAGNVQQMMEQQMFSEGLLKYLVGTLRKSIVAFFYRLKEFTADLDLLDFWLSDLVEDEEKENPENSLQAFFLTFVLSRTREDEVEKTQAILLEKFACGHISEVARRLDINEGTLRDKWENRLRPLLDIAFLRFCLFHLNINRAYDAIAHFVKTESYLSKKSFADALLFSQTKEQLASGQCSLKHGFYLSKMYRGLSETSKWKQQDGEGMMAARHLEKTILHELCQIKNEMN